MNLNNHPLLTQNHLAALNWFNERIGLEIGWPAPLNGMFLVNKAKGIHKPQGIDFALSIRQSLNGPYDDALSWSSDGSWHLKYHYEGSNPDYFTNRALRACHAAGVPVGILLQMQQKPSSIYKVLGLGLVTDDKEGVFTLHQYSTITDPIESAVSVGLPVDTFNATNMTDARLREFRAIAIRQGQPEFRKKLIYAYGGICAISGCSITNVLEAAHILPYRGAHTNNIKNGILLRTDLHTLFDLGLLRIEPENYKIFIKEALHNSEYFMFHGNIIRLPINKEYWPDKEALRSKVEMACLNL